MASGMGARGTVGRCYGFFADLKQCQEEMPSGKDADGKFTGCGKSREDYFECLHGNKQRARQLRVLAEQNKQAMEAKHGTSSIPAAH